MKWEDLVGLVEQVFDDVIREEGENLYHLSRVRRAYL